MYITVLFSESAFYYFTKMNEFDLKECFCNRISRKNLTETENEYIMQHSE